MSFSKIASALSNRRGFTLIEMAIVITIAGVLIGSLAASLSGFQKSSISKASQQGVSTVQQALRLYLENNGRMPCPASPTLPSGDANFGRETCTTADGVISVAGRAGRAVLIGTVPTRTLNIPDNMMLDAYSNRLTYAITDNLTRESDYNQEEGAITILDMNGNSVTEPTGQAQFALISHGPDGKGAYTRDGTRIACTGTTGDSSNCDDDATFRQSITFSGGATGEPYDDTMAYTLGADIPLWVDTLWRTNGDDIYNRNVGNIGIALDGNVNQYNPSARLQIESRFRATPGVTPFNYNGAGVVVQDETDFIALTTANIGPDRADAYLMWGDNRDDIFKLMFRDAASNNTYEAMRVTPTDPGNTDAGMLFGMQGRLGIGTNQSRAKLELFSPWPNIVLSGSQPSSTAADLNFEDRDGPVWWHQTLRGDSGNLEFHGRNTLFLGGGPAVIPLAMTLSNRVGIAHANPVATLDVNGDGLVRGKLSVGRTDMGPDPYKLTVNGGPLRLESNGQQSLFTSGGIKVEGGSSHFTSNTGVGPSPNFGYMFSVDGTTLLSGGDTTVNNNLFVNGSQRIQGGLEVIQSVKANAFMYTSDRRLKEDIKPLAGSLDKVLKLEGVSYKFKGKDQQQVGLIAQDVEKVYPELVATDENGMKSVSYGQLVAPLIEAVKAQQQQIEALKAELDALKHDAPQKQ